MLYLPMWYCKHLRSYLAKEFHYQQCCIKQFGTTKLESLLGKRILIPTMLMQQKVLQHLRPCLTQEFLYQQYCAIKMVLQHLRPCYYIFTGRDDWSEMRCCCCDVRFDGPRGLCSGVASLTGSTA